MMIGGWGQNPSALPTYYSIQKCTVIVTSQTENISHYWKGFRVFYKNYFQILHICKNIGEKGVRPMLKDMKEP